MPQTASKPIATEFRHNRHRTSMIQNESASDNKKIQKPQEILNIIGKKKSKLIIKNFFKKRTIKKSKFWKMKDKKQNRQTQEKTQTTFTFPNPRITDRKPSPVVVGFHRNPN